MACRGCGSDNQRSFTSEVAVHFSGRKGLGMPIVSVFPKLAVCLDVAFTEFTVPEKELRVLVQGNPVQGAVVLAENLAGRPKILIGDVVMHNYAMVLKPFTFGASPKSNEPTYRSGTFTSSYVLVDHF